MHPLIVFTNISFLLRMMGKSSIDFEKIGEKLYSFASFSNFK